MRGKSGVWAVAVAAWCALLLSPASTRAQHDVAPTRDYVVDTAQVLGPDARRAIDDWLQELQQKTGAQVKVLTVRTTGGEEFFTFVERQFEHWKLGQAGKNDGALIALAVDDHHVRIHSGYGLEPVLPDSWCGSVSREAASTYFKSGRYDAGLIYIVKAVAFRIAQQQGVTLRGIPQQVHQPANQQGSSGWAILIVLLILFAVFWFRKRGPGDQGRGGRGMWMSQPWLGSGWGSSFGGGGGGGSFGGGSFGGGGSTGGGGGGASW